MLNKLENHFNNPTLSDFTVKCNGEEFKVHRLVLSCYKYFEMAISEQYAEGKSRTLNLDEEPTNIIEPLLRFLYTNQLPANDTEGLGFLTELFIAADKYGIAKLKQATAERFRSTAECMKHKDQASPSQYDAWERELLLKCLKRLDESIPSSDPILHNSFDAFFLRNRTKLLTSDADARDFLAACPELAARVTMLAVTDRVPPYNAQHLPCPDCRSPQCIHPGSDLRGCQRCTSCRALLRVMYSPNGASCEHDWNMVPKLIKATDEWSDGWG